MSRIKAKEWLLGTLTLIFIGLCGSLATQWGNYTYELLGNWEEVPVWRIKWIALFIWLLIFTIPPTTILFALASFSANENKKESSP